MISSANETMNYHSNRSFLASAKVENIYGAAKSTVFRLPLFMNPKAIPTSAEKFTCREGRLDLNEYLIHNPSTTFLIRVTGNSMLKAGINSGDILVVDRSIRASNGKIVVAAINDELLVKRLRYTDEGTYLVSESDDFAPIKINIEDKFDIWGVVSSIIKTM
ncbi:MAG: translesion error-prone DNA polymerase V autoproteolytic subunit [Candidatus Kapabacteria bacterium]|jgi:DNA polymerase V|nr:translesion error-prone DNA polymerase V autoproteolytic subunit [Candidatus Kapabacteria bacterium]